MKTAIIKLIAFIWNFMGKENNRLNFIVSFCALIVSLIASTFVICQSISQDESNDNLRYSFRLDNSFINIQQANSKHVINQLSIEFNTKYSKKTVDIPMTIFGDKSFDIENFETEIINNIKETNCKLIEIPFIIKSKYVSNGKNIEDQSLCKVISEINKSVDGDYYFNIKSVDQGAKISNKYDKKINVLTQIKCINTMAN